MRKTVEVEYVGREDVIEIMNGLFALKDMGNYICFEISNFRDTPKVSIAIMLGGWECDKLCDYQYNFYMTDKEADVKVMNECKNTLNNLLAED